MFPLTKSNNNFMPFEDTNGFMGTRNTTVVFLAFLETHSTSLNFEWNLFTYIIDPMECVAYFFLSFDIIRP